MKKFWEHPDVTMAGLTDVLTKVRPVSFVRKLQLGLVMITLAMVTYFLAVPFFGQKGVDLSKEGPFPIGKISSETILSSKEIVYDNEEKTRAEQLKAYQSAPYVFDRDYTVLTGQIQSYVSEDIENLKQVTTTEKAANVFSAILQKNIRWRNRSREDIDILVRYPRKERIKELINQCTGILFSSYCISKEIHPEMNSILNSGARVRNKGSKENVSTLDGSSVFPRSYIYNNPETSRRMSLLVEEKLTNVNPDLLSSVKKICYSYVYSFPSCNYNRTETENEKRQSESKVIPVKSKIAAGEVIIKSGDLITPEVHGRLEILNKYATRANITSILSILIVQLAFVGIIVVFLKKYDPKRLNDVSSNVIVFSMIWLTAISSFLASRFFYQVDSAYETTYYFAMFVPVGMVCLLLAFIYDEQLAIAIGFYLSFFIFIASRNNSTSFIISFTTSIVAAAYAVNIRKRIDFIKAGFLISFIQMLIATSGYLFDSRSFWTSNPSDSFFNDLVKSNIFKLYLVCFINGFACSFASQFLLPVYEYVFNIPTKFKLQELADTGHPLLQALLTKAPSTYTHTFMVAAMSERAAQNLGLDWLLTRVGVYFHDIGKIPNAAFFVENQHLIPKKENIDKNNPGRAAKIVIDHVLDGIEMAKKARLPREIINFIPEHHGTSTMAFFYHKALADLSPSQRKKINKKDFMYPGPKPQRKETAIVMIADSLEAASRSLEEVTPEILDELIQKIINIKLAENQLDECGLTLGDLGVIKSSFKEVLLSSLHARPKYPSTEETKKLEKEK